MTEDYKPSAGTHPITPSPELVQQIRNDALHKADGQLEYELRMIHAAYRAGADQELEACVEWLVAHGWFGSSNSGALCGLRAARRPKPPSLKEQALKQLSNLESDEPGYCSSFGIIRRALEQLDD